MTPSSLDIHQKGSVLHRRMRSAVLGILKGYNIYLPAGYDSSSVRYPVLYLLRGHEREWINANEDPTRKGRTIVHILDELIARYVIAPMIVVMPGLSSDDNSVHSCGIDMLAPPKTKGIGSGRFHTWFIDEFIPHIDARYRTKADRGQRALDGFSLGGYAAMLFAFQHPHLFASVGSYDGLFPWRDFIDPRVEGKKLTDRVFLTGATFDAAFGVPRSIAALKAHHPIRSLERASRKQLAFIRSMRFHIHSAAYDGARGNIDRARHFIEHLHRFGIANSFVDPVLSAHALHDWHHADEHMKRSLRAHDAVFSQSSNVSRAV